MVFISLTGAFFAIAFVAAREVVEVHELAVMLIRQEPGTPAYNCHDNCGQAITLSKANANVCENEAFLSDYKNCLQCSGPDNEDIWKMYGNTLSKVGASCDLSTTPLSGKQPDVGPAIAASSQSSSGAAPSATSSIAITTGTKALASSTIGSSSTQAPNGTFAATPTTTSIIQQSTNGASNMAFANPAGLFGWVVMELMYGLGN
ncbi:uncharacterized protein BDR25DRAFT_301542 [Lindgomyces ingoldianus]|uniref:Uncharacterized protein n=1 Tax=Lindgomyces ingoldianus TaxID=673940 RepID=A0ACB6R971_9PLEO|nr:uncharacterized protein BDR25DRAFT_301542 [Lindgomyces ingoldianus]KAF2475062.1 hypothetical protein BDR25DRAFT_301542 [Lindgomyces ingoldianus]